MSTLEKRIEQALILVLAAEELQAQGTASAWETARQYERAALLLDLAAQACLVRSRGCWSSEERTDEGAVERVWIGEEEEIRRG